jgi:hypothetical protein
MSHAHGCMMERARMVSAIVTALRTLSAVAERLGDDVARWHRRGAGLQRVEGGERFAHRAPDQPVDVLRARVVRVSVNSVTIAWTF